MHTAAAFPWSVSSPSILFQPMCGQMNMGRLHPSSWSKDDVFKWVEWCVDEYSLGEISQDKFSMNGKALMLLSKEDFKERAPHAGDILHTTLQKLLDSVLSPSVVKAPPHSPFPYYPSPITYGPPVRHHTESGLSQVFMRSDSFPLQQPLSPTNIGQQFSTIRPRTLTSPSFRTSVDDRRRISPSQDSVPSLSPPLSASESDTSSVEMPPVLRSPVSTKSDQIDQTMRPVNLPTECTHPQTLKLKNNKECRLLWEFIGRLLTDPKRAYESCIRWEEEASLVFRITNPAALAHLWGMQKNRNNMTYEKLSRALRYYYRMNIIEKVPGRRLTYRFIHPPDEIKVERTGCRYRPQKTVSNNHEVDMEPCKQEVTSVDSTVEEGAKDECDQNDQPQDLSLKTEVNPAVVKQEND